MKLKNTLRCISTLSISSLLILSSAHAQSTLYWDGGTVDIPTDGNGASGGTAGTWDTTLLNWDAGVSPHVAWDNSNTLENPADFAVFAGTAGTVTLGTNITAGGLTFNTNSYSISGSTLTLAGATTPIVNVSTGTSTISSDIAGTAGLEKTGGSTLVLSGTNNTISGTATISAGTLQGNKSSTSGPSPFGTSTIQLNAGTLASFTVSANDTTETFTFGNDVIVGGNATINFTRVGGVGSGKTHAYGNLSIGNNTLSLTANAINHTLSFTGANLTGNATINTGNNATTNISAISETGGSRNLTKQGGATLRLTGTNTYTGTTTISSGSLQLGFGGTTGSLTRTSGITNNGNLTINRTNTFAQATDLNGQVITGSGSFNQAGTGITVLTGDNTYTGQTTITTGTLVVSKMANYSADSSIGWGTSGTSIAMGSNSSLVYTGTAISNTDRQIDFTPSGTSAAQSPSILNNGTGALNFTASTFNTGTVTNNNRGLILGGTNGGTISGAMVFTGANTSQGFWSLAKNGSGTWTLAGANTNSGETALNAGTLRLDYNASNTSKLSNVATVGFLRLNGGTLELYGGSHDETVLGTTLNNGTTFIKRTNAPSPAPASSSTLQMGVITYSGGALDFSVAGIANVSTSAVTNGILSSATGTARVTVGGADWAAKDGSNNVIAYAGYADFDGTASAANINYRTIGNATLTANRGATSNTFKITTSGAGQSMKLNNDFNLTLGSLLFAGADNYTIAAESGAGRINSSFLLHNHGAGTLTLGATNGVITQFGTGTTILSGNNAANVGINIFGGTVEFSNNLQIGTNASAQVISLNNGTLRANTSGTIALNSSGNFSRTVTLGAGGGTLDIIGGGTMTVSGVISSATASQLPTLTIGSESSNGTIELTGTNTYNGRTFISGGTLKLGANDVLPNGSAVSIGTATLDADTRTDTVGTLDVTGSAVINLGTGAALVFANSSAVGAGTWAGTLNLVGFVSGSSLNFGSSAGLTAAQLAKISATGFSNFSLDAEGDLIADFGGGGGPGPLDNFVISTISTPQTVGTAITGITITAKDASNQTVTSFTGNVTFGGTGGFSGTSANFTAGELTGVSVTPTVAGSNLTFTVTDGVSGKTGSTTIATIQTPYQAWANGGAFEADANKDGVANGMAFLLGASSPNVSALDKLPKSTESSGDLVLEFQMLADSADGAASLAIEHSTSLVDGSWTTVPVPYTSSTVGDIVFTITGTNPLNVTATIPVSKASNGKLFGRVKGMNP